MNRRIRITLLAISLLLVIGTLGWLTHVLLVQAEETGRSEQRIGWRPWLMKPSWKWTAS